MNNGRDCPHGRQVGKCDTCDLIKAELELGKCQAECKRLQSCLDSKTEIANQLKDGMANMFEKNVALQADRDALAAQLVALNKLHSDLTNADMVLDDGEHSGYLITSEQLEDMEHYLSEPILCLAAHDAEVAAKAVLEFAAKLLVNQKVDVIDCAKTEADQLRTKAGA